jgi:hypothetical protein
MDDGATSNAPKPFLAVLLLFVAVVFNGCAYFRPEPTYSAEESPRGGIKILTTPPASSAARGNSLTRPRPFMSGW